MSRKKYYYAIGIKRKLPVYTHFAVCLAYTTSETSVESFRTVKIFTRAHISKFPFPLYGEEKLPSKYSSHTFAVLNLKNARKKVPSNISPPFPTPLPPSMMKTHGRGQYILKYTCARWFGTFFILFVFLKCSGFFKKRLC